MGIYARINTAIKAGMKKVFVIGYVDGNGCTFTEADSLEEARRIKAIMTDEGHTPFIDVYAR